jgi:hypothetical protein
MLDGFLQIDAQIKQRVGVKKTGASRGQDAPNIPHSRDRRHTRAPVIKQLIMAGCVVKRAVHMAVNQPGHEGQARCVEPLNRRIGEGISSTADGLNFVANDQHGCQARGRNCSVDHIGVLDQQLLRVHGGVNWLLFPIRKLDFYSKNLILNMETYVLFFDSIAQYARRARDFCSPLRILKKCTG